MNYDICLPFSLLFYLWPKLILLRGKAGRVPAIQRVERQREREGITADRREGEDPEKTTAKNSWPLPINSQNGCKDVNYLEVKT